MQPLKGERGESGGRWGRPHAWGRSFIAFKISTNFIQKVSSSPKEDTAQHQQSNPTHTTPPRPPTHHPLQHLPHQKWKNQFGKLAKYKNRSIEQWDWRVLCTQSAWIALLLGGCLAGCLFGGRLVGRLLGCLAGWFAGWSAGVVGCLAAWLAGLLPALLAAWLVGKLVGWLLGCLAAWLSGSGKLVHWADCFIGLLADWLVICLAAWLADWLVDWFPVEWVA